MSTPSLRSRLNLRKSKLATVATTIGAMVAIASQAQAQVTTYTPLGITGEYISFDPVNGDSSTTDQAEPITVSVSGLDKLDLNSSLPDYLLESSYVMSVGDTISGGSSFDAGTSLFSVSSLISSTGETFYVGYKFDDGEASPQYGYATIFHNGFNLTLTEFNLSPTSVTSVTISATAVPEPSTYALSFGALVLVGVVMWKRLRHRATVRRQAEPVSA